MPEEEGERQGNQRTPACLTHVAVQPDPVNPFLQKLRIAGVLLPKLPTAEDSPHFPPYFRYPDAASYDLIDEGLSFKVPSEKWVCSLSSARNT